MTRTRYRFLPDDPAPYFITATTVNWLPLFSNPEITCILIDSLQFLINQQRMKLFAYVIMENHLHLIASGEDLSRDIGSFKSFTARKCILYYQKNNSRSILEQLAFQKSDYKIDRYYQFWQEGSHPQRIIDEKVLRQKVEYIHNNPVRRGYIDLAEHWRYSSARNYANMEGILPISWEF